jgi:hypothetical protein
MVSISSLCLLACKVSAEKSAHSLVEDPLYVMNLLSLAAFIILSGFIFGA